MSSNILLIGGGGREHAICKKLADAIHVRKIFVCPGNAGTRNETKCENICLNVECFGDVVKFCKKQKIDLVFVGPEDPLDNGIVDHLESKGLLTFGPSRCAAQIETSKSFSKAFMTKYHIPTADYRVFDNSKAAIKFIETGIFPRVVIKASGLAAGKGVFLPQTNAEAIALVRDIIDEKSLGPAGAVIVIEEYLTGTEVSCLAFTDGRTIACMPPTQDYKKLSEKVASPNTGGMGAYCPCTLITNSQLLYVKRDVLQKAIDGLRQDDIIFKGVLYAGLILTESGPKVLEFNCRFGDPEAQVILPLMISDLYEVVKACCNNGLAAHGKVDFDDTKSALCVVAVSGGYPQSYPKGMQINGLGQISNTTDVELHVVHAGTILSTIESNVFFTNGGRVLALVGTGSDLWRVQTAVYQSIQNLQFEGMFYRKDIGSIALKRLSTTYTDAGVSISSGKKFVKLIKPICRETSRSGCMDNIGLFGASFDLKATGFVDPILVSGTDGVGTKLKVALDCKKFDTIGVDLVAMCVNDILCHGAVPLFFLDYFACGTLDPAFAAAVVKGIAKGCTMANCALVGGETAEMPGMYSSGDFDMAGFVVGAVERSMLLPRTRDLQVGDAVVGLPSTGFHSNGFSLVRKIVKRCNLEYSSAAPFDATRTIGEVLLKPTQIYVLPVIEVLKKFANQILALCHITGGGLMDNIPRILTKDLAVELDASLWTVPDEMLWIAQETRLSGTDVCRVFNAGIGFVIICRSAVAHELTSILYDQHGIAANIIGHIIHKVDSTSPLIHLTNFPTDSLPVLKGRTLERKVRVGVLISGVGNNLQALINHCSKDSACEIMLVLSNTVGAHGLQRAKKAGIAVETFPHTNYANREEFEKVIDSVLQDYGCELVCLAGFMRIFSSFLVQRWRGKMLNIHPSLLPSFKGANAHKLVLESGVRITGATVHFVVEKVDSGAIVAQDSCRVLPNDTEKTLADRVMVEVEQKIYPEAMELVARKRCSLSQGNKVLWHN